MAITLASDAFSDAEITDGIGLGDLSSAARLWVRHWQGALAAAQQFVEPAEVPGLAAEALIGTIAAIGIGRGPREDVAGFVSAAVRELGEDDEPAVLGDPVPVLFVSAAMTSAFAELDADLQRDLRDGIRDGRTDERTEAALTVLQHYYLAEHTDRAPSQACRRTHIAFMSTADGSAREGLAGATWLHLSTCAWCTEAFHEIACSSAALGSLIDPAALDRVPAAPVVPLFADEVVEPAPVEAPSDPLEDTAAWVPAFEPEDEAFPPSAIAPPVVEPDVIDPLQQVPEELVPDEPVTTEHAAVRRAGPLALVRGGRGRLVAATVASAAAIAVLAVVLGQTGDSTTPASALGDPTKSAAIESPSTDADPSFGAPETPSSSPTGTTTVAGPLTTAAATATAAATSGATSPPKPSAEPTKKPTKKPTAQPTQSAPPSPTAAPTTAEPAPTATPTKRCNALGHLLGLC